MTTEELMKEDLYEGIEYDWDEEDLLDALGSLEEKLTEILC